jgi:hypothetical protein
LLFDDVGKFYRTQVEGDVSVAPEDKPGKGSGTSSKSPAAADSLSLNPTN